MDRSLNPWPALFIWDCYSHFQANGEAGVAALYSQQLHHLLLRDAGSSYRSGDAHDIPCLLMRASQEGTREANSSPIQQEFHRYVPGISQRTRPSRIPKLGKRPSCLSALKELLQWREKQFSFQIFAGRQENRKVCIIFNTLVFKHWIWGWVHVAHSCFYQSGSKCSPSQQ